MELGLFVEFSRGLMIYCLFTFLYSYVQNEQGKLLDFNDSDSDSDDGSDSGSDDGSESSQDDPNDTLLVVSTGMLEYAFAAR